MSKIEEAKRILRGEAATVDELFDVGKALKREQKFDLARRIFAQAAAQTASDDARRRTIIQQQASCTEKDPDLPLDRRFEEGREIIKPVLLEAEQFFARPLSERRDASDDLIRSHQETFGIAGAIEKRCWEADPKPRHLRRSFQLYECGYRLGMEPDRAHIPDQGYTGINAAFVLDLMANQEEIETAEAKERQLRARAIRQKIADKLSVLPPEARDWWVLATLAEASLGLGQYGDAEKWLAEAALWKPKLENWEYETAVKQFARLAILQAKGEDKTAEHFRQSPAWQALKKFVGEDDESGLWTAFSGKVGLALSGGGFRASLFHLGVLARLAELDMLRHVEVISCVSGGSIIGALYYLRLRNLLESPPERGITREDYIQLVHAMEQEFMNAIIKNPRMRVFSQLTRLFSRTERMGELLDRTLYGPAAGLAKGKRPILRDLIVKIKNNPAFRPKYDNWRRQHKVPILILNATTLNTGHNWQFTASFMGESPNTIDPEVDGNERLRRMYYEHEAPAAHKNVPLGRAVAASAAVPGLFSPIKLTGLYPDRKVELVDGGVHDNQGVGSLREQDCTVLLVSDASGQLGTELNPARHPFAVLSRSNNTLMSRVRELEHAELRARKRAGLLRDFMFVHLKKDLIVEPVDWVGCDLKKDDKPLEGASPQSDDLTRYGVRGRVQNFLSGIRTDLDAFSEAEAFGLMASGYKMTTWDFRQCITTFTGEAEPDPRWRFHHVGRFLQLAAQAGRFDAALERAANLLFKGAMLLPGAALLARLTGRFFRLASIVLFVLLLIGFWVLVSLIPIPELRIIAALIILLGLAFGGIYWITRLFDRLYLRRGSLRHVAESE